MFESEHAMNDARESGVPITLADLGWNARFAESFARIAPQVGPESGIRPGRVCAQSESTFALFLVDGTEAPAVMSGRLTALAAADPACRPVVGDWVACSPGGGSGAMVIRDVLPRQTVFQRKTATAVTSAQVVAANLTTLFLVVSADAGFNLRRMERYLVQALESGAEPVLLLNKSDLADDPDGLVAELAAIAPGHPVFAVSATHGHGLAPLAPYLAPGRTVALLGSSGVGKSTLVNAIAGTDLRRTGAVREDDRRGRHTTTDRRLLRLPAGALLLDTPGMRELALWADADTVDEAFPDIAALAGGCRFADCAHEAEPGCAVKRAVEAGDLPPKRLKSYLKLAAEAARLERRRAARARDGGPPGPAGGRKRRYPDAAKVRQRGSWD